MAATHVNHMQKALDQMNLQLHHVISDIVGQTGLAIVDAILAGERDPEAALIKRAVRLAPLVVEDANAWWDLPRLAGHLRAHPELERDQTLADGLAAVALAAGQRRSVASAGSRALGSGIDMD
jgi:hypothetical protein